MALSLCNLPPKNTKTKGNHKKNKFRQRASYDIVDQLLQLVKFLYKHFCEKPRETCYSQEKSKEMFKNQM